MRNVAKINTGGTTRVVRLKGGTAGGTPPMDGDPDPRPPIWVSNYGLAPNANSVVPPWAAEQEPQHVNPTANRITVVQPGDLPGTGTYKPAVPAMRVELRPWSLTNPGTNTPADGDVQNSSGYLANRAEVYGRVPTSLSGTPPEGWPDPVGSERWYRIPVLFPTDFVEATDAKWLSFTQFKGFRGGSPPLALEVKRSEVRLGGTKAAVNFGSLTKGVWQEIVVGMKLTNVAADGWVKVYQNGVLKVDLTNIATMDSYNGGADPIYLKQGIYRGWEWGVTHTLYLGPVTVGSTLASVYTRTTNTAEGTNATTLTTTNTGTNGNTPVSIISRGTGATSEFSTAQKAQGTSSFRFINTASQSNYLRWDTGITSDQAYFRTFVYMPTAWTNATEIFNLRNGAGTQAVTMIVSSAMRLSLVISSNQVFQATSGQAFVAGTWYMVEMGLNRNGGTDAPWAINCTRLDGTVLFASSGTAATATYDVSSLRIGKVSSSAEATDIYFDAITLELGKSTLEGLPVL